jgi:hypothetical protein
MSLFFSLISYSLPLELVKAIPSRQKVLHRLVYRCFPVQQDGRDPMATNFIRLEVPLVDLKEVQLPVGLPGGGVLAGTMCSSGRSSNLDVLMPDRYGFFECRSGLHLMIVCQSNGPSLRCVGHEPPRFRSVAWWDTQLFERSRKIVRVTGLCPFNPGLTLLQFDLQ